MIRYIIKRILWLIPVIIIVAFIIFALMEAAPGNAIHAILAYATEMTPEERDELIRLHNLDRPMIYRFGLYMLNLIQGDLGVGDITKTPVWPVFISRLPNTLILAFSSLIIGMIIALPLGIIAARRAGTLIDNSVTVFTLVGMSMPAFWVGLMLLLLFGLRLGVLPIGNFDQGIRSLIMPALVGSFTLMATTARQTRSNMLEVLKSDYLRTARAKGVPEEVVIRKHALGNAWIPIITAIGISLSTQLAGAVVIEQVFTWPGIGRMAAEAVVSRDVTTVTGVVIMTTILYVIVQLTVDILYAFVDPRIKAQYMSQVKKRKKPNRRAEAAKKPDVSRAESMIQEQEKELPAESVAVISHAQEPEPAEAPESKSESAATDSAEQRAGEVSFVTRTFSKTATEIEQSNERTADAGAPEIKRNKKRSQMTEIIHHIYKNKGAMAGLIIFGIMLIMVIVSLFISWDSVVTMSPSTILQSPSMKFPFGTDRFGRDVLMRVLYGTRFTLAIGFGSVAFGAIFGLPAGAIAGFFGGKVDDFILRVSDIIASTPGLLLGMVIVTVLGQSLQNLIIAVGIQAVPIYLRMIRSSTITVRNNEFVEAARAIGFSNFRIIFTQVVPNGLAPVIVTLTASLGLTIIIASSLSFLGFGIPVPSPEWGAMMAENRDVLRAAPWLTAIPGILIMLAVLAFNLLGDGLRDALDPKLKKR